jgi:hypothetical protein
MAVAVPLSVATLPIGSGAGACAGAFAVDEGAAGEGVAGEGAGDAEGGAAGRAGCGDGEGAGWACASRAAAEIALASDDTPPSSIAEGGA